MPNVSEITQQLREIIQGNPDLQDVWIHGRISEIKSTPGGTLNFTLTGGDRKIKCVIFNREVSLPDPLPPVGSSVSVKGQVYVYQAISEYRFKVTNMPSVGAPAPSPSFSITALTDNLKSTLRNHPAVKVQGEIAKVFITNRDFKILKLKDVSLDQEFNKIIECVLKPGIDPPFSLQQGDRITVEGKFNTFTAAGTYLIVIDNPNRLRKQSAPVPPPNTCQKCRQRCEDRYPLCSLCYYAQVHHEGIVVGAVTRYFDSPRFANFSTEREHWIRLIGHIRGRADIVLRRGNEEGLSAIAECKRIGYDGNDGIDQLKSYLIASGTKLGLFADNTDPYEWTFLKRNDARNRYDKITRSQFERELGVEPTPEIPPTKTQLELIHGNIIDSEVDAIVNAADSNLKRGDGVDRAIRDAGGEEIDRECQEIFDREGVCPPGKAIITTGGNLPARSVIHAVGPIWQDGNRSEPDLLADCYKNSLQLAVENGILSIAFPAISTGNFRYPIEKAATVALNAVKEFVEQARQNNEMVPERIQFVLFDEEAYTCYVNTFSNLGLGLFAVIG